MTDAFAKAKRRDTADRLEITRIVALPIVGLPTDEEVEAVSREVVQAEHFERGYRLHREQAGGLLAFDLYDGLFGPIGVGRGKCVSGETEFCDPTRGRRRADDLGPAYVYGADGDRHLTPRPAEVVASGRKQCLRLRTRGGSEVTLSADHPVLTHRGWVRALDLRAEDLIATPRYLPEPVRPFSVEREHVELLGYLIADGCFTGSHCCFVDDSPAVLDRVEQLGASQGWRISRAAERSRATRLNLAGAREFVRRWGIGCLSKDKRLPAELYNMSTANCAAFLRAFWACDGHVSKDKLEVILASEGLIRDLRHLLLRLGIVCRTGYKKARIGAAEYDAWRLVVSGSMVEKWVEAVGTPLGCDERVERLLVAREGLRSNPNVDVVPITRGDHVEIAEWLGARRSQVRDALGLTAGQWLGRAAFERFCQEENYRGRHAWLADTDLFWDRLDECVPVGVRQVYDLATGDANHNFVGGNVVLHNTDLTILIADRAFKRGDSKRSLLIVPPNVLGQLVQTDIPRARRVYGIRVPFVVMAGKDRRARLSAASSGKVGCYVMPYSYLSTRDAEEVLVALAADLLILDEAHRVKNRKAARTARLMRAVVRCGPRIVALSGTITSKSIRDYHHLANHALRENSPLPHEQVLADAWAALVDANAGDDPGSAQTGPIVPLMDWARREFPEAEVPRGLPGFRAAYRLRLNSAPGVISSGDAELGTSLLIRNTPVDDPAACSGYAEVQQMVRQVEELWISPSGDEIEHGMHKWRHLYELTSGFFYRLRWPEIAELVERRRLAFDEATAYLAQAQEHHEALQEYHRQLRRWLERRGRPGLDTPFLVASDMARHGAEHVGDGDLFAAWHAAKDLEFDGMPERVSEPVRVSPWKIEHVAVQAAAERAAGLADGENGGVLVWYYHNEVGRWLVEALEAAGEEPLWCPADATRPGSSARILDPASAARIVVASMSGHGEGKNLQAFRRQVLAEFPRKADLLEQVLGRTHRYGQQADELVPVTVNTSEFDHQNMSACLIDAVYIHQSTGSRQKAVYAAYDPLPRIYPSDFLRERGFVDLPQLDKATVALLEEKYGAMVARGAAGR